MASVAGLTDCDVVVLLNKCDLDRADDLYAIYTAAGFPTLRVSAETGEGIEELKPLIAGKLSAFSGNSGVGKSSILNALEPGLRLETGDVSEKLGRGRHTTRHVEIFPAGGAWVADTPGFASFDMEQLPPIPKEELQHCFPEFEPYIGRCRFDDCAHLKEPSCAVRAAVEAAALPKGALVEIEGVEAL